MQLVRKACVLVLVLLCCALGVEGLAREARHSIVINLPEYRLWHFIGQEMVASYPISIGRAVTPTPTTTPTRRFEIFNKVRHPAWRSPITRQVMPPGPANPLGTRWLGLMTIDRLTLQGHETWESLARQHRTTVSALRTLNNLPAHARVVPGMTIEVHRHDGYGIHGTNAPTSIGTSVSLGCMRMHNRDVEVLFDMLPSRGRIPVTIRYEPVVERKDSITQEAYIEIFHDVYGRIEDWAAHITDAATRIGALAPAWLRTATSEPFSGSFLLSMRPRVENNGHRIAVGAVEHDNSFFLPLPVMQQLLGVEYSEIGGQAFLGDKKLRSTDMFIFNQQLFLRAGLIADKTGRGYFYDPLQNAVQLSLTRLVLDGSTVQYHSVFIHPELGALVSVCDLAAVLNITPGTLAQGRILLGGQVLVAHTLGRLTFVSLPELRRIVPHLSWDIATGALSITTR